MALYVTPSSCPASPAESFEKPHAASAIQVVEPKDPTAENTVASIKSRPPSGIMFAVFRAVKQFLTLLTLFSLEFYSWSKIAKNKANIVYSGGSPGSGIRSVRAKKSRFAGMIGIPGSGFC
jgi:hypothetical protein